MVYIINVFSNHLPSTRKSSQYTESPAISLDPLETISKKRTRKIAAEDDLERTCVDEEESDPVARSRKKPWSRTKRAPEQTRNWRPDEDEMCLTTTTIHGSDKDGSKAGMEEFLREGREDGGITMTREFEWDEGRRSRGVDK